MSERTGIRVELCRCEQISLAAAEQAIAEGARTINDVKRRTRAGMGVCQGAYCTRAIAQLLLRAGVPPAEIAPMTPRPPARVIPIAVLAAIPE